MTVKWTEIENGWTVHSGQHWVVCRAVQLGRGYWRIQYADDNFAHLVTDPVSRAEAFRILTQWRDNLQARGCTLGGKRLMP